MATPIKPTPKLSNSQFSKFSRDLEANRSNKISQEKKTEMKAIFDRVMSTKR